MEFMLGMLFGLVIGYVAWIGEREQGKLMKKYYDEAVKDCNFWKKMYDKNHKNEKEKSKS